MSRVGWEVPRQPVTERLLILFTRFPEPDTAKTRLIPALGPAGAARLQRRMTERTISRASASPAGYCSWETQIRFDGGDCALMHAWLGGSGRCLSQGTGDLGERLRRAFAAGFTGGAASVVVIGTDCPDLGAADIADAFGALEAADAVFGPALDGGYWLVGLRKGAFPTAAEPLFAGIPWGGREVFAASRSAARRAGLTVACLRTLSDVDRPEDLSVWERALRADSAGETITVVIPTLEEISGIRALVGGLLTAAGVEVIVADGGSSDGTPLAAAAAGARVVTSRRGRAAQMNAGAAAGGGSILLFLHADTRLPEGWAASVRSLLQDAGVSGGAFSFATDSRRFPLRVIGAAARWRGRLLGILFGDQAIFARRAHFEALGGFPDQPLMEDYEFVRRLRRRGRVITLPLRAVSSARRWETHGPWRNSLKNAAITAAYLAGISPERLARWYRGGG